MGTAAAQDLGEDGVELLKGEAGERIVFVDIDSEGVEADAREGCGDEQRTRPGKADETFHEDFPPFGLRPDLLDRGHVEV